ncbi:MAG: hypothetical protein LGB58_04575, partial [Sulfurovum sp.]|nr:hypothetical protein [Sulfurovum sp.]
TTGSTDTGITLYDENNNEVPLDGNSTTRISGGTYSSTKGWPHTYYVRVKHRNPSGTGDYSLVVKIVSDVGGYNYATAEKIQPNSTIHAALNFDDDQDYFEINITSAGTLTVGTLTVSPKTNKDATDTYGFLYRKEDLTSLTSVDKLSSEGDTVNWIGANNNIYNDGSNRNFRIIKQVTPGIYYVRVRGYYNEFSGPDTNHLQTGEYKFYSQFVADDHGSTKETATFIDKTVVEELSKTATVPGRIDFAGDEDWFKIVTTYDTGSLTVKTTGSTDTVVTLYDQNDNEVPLDGNSTTRILGGTSSSTEGSHTYYVRVKHRNSSGTGDYSLVVKLAFDVGGDIYATATTIQPNSTIQAAINFATDQDYFKIVLPYAGTLTVGTTGTTNTYGHLYNEKDLVSLTYEDYRDWNRTWLTSNNNIYNDASDTNFRIIKYLTAGTYYVRVRSYYQPYGADKDHLKTGEYTLYSQFSDHGNSRSTATSINPNSTTEGRFERAGDEDFFKIVISHSATLTLKTTGSTDTVGT